MSNSKLGYLWINTKMKFKLSGLMAVLAVCMMSSSVCADDVAGITDFGTAGVRAITVEKEKEMGELFVTVAKSQLPVIYDPVLEQYVASLLSRMAARADGVKYPFEPIIVEDHTINAAAFFGGKIMLNSGLIVATDNESQLASVLAHEMTHVTQRHLARSMEARQDAMVTGIAGIVGSLILGVINPAVGMAGVSASIGGMAQSNINYTRANEYEADRLGIDLLYNSGFNPNAMADMMRKLQVRGENFNPAFEMLLTHPLSSKRVAEAENRARFYKVKPYYESIDFSFAKSRVEVRYSNISPKFNLEAAKQRLTKSQNDYGSWYMMALAALELNDYATAEKALNKLKVDYGRNLFVIDTLTDFYVAKGEYAKAESLLKEMIKSKGEQEVFIVNLANVYIESKNYAKAENLLKRYRRNAKSVTADSLLKTAYMKQNKTCELYQINTDILESKGQWNQAINSVNEALRYCNEKNTVLRLKALASRIVEERDFYDKLIAQ